MVGQVRKARCTSGFETVRCTAPGLLGRWAVPTASQRGGRGFSAGPRQRLLSHRGREILLGRGAFMDELVSWGWDEVGLGIAVGKMREEPRSEIGQGVDNIRNHSFRRLGMDIILSTHSSFRTGGLTAHRSKYN